MMKMSRGLLSACAVAAALSLSHTGARADKANDTLTFATASEVDTVDLYYQNLREVVIIAQQMCDTLMYRDPRSNEYKPLLGTSYRWIDDKTLEFKLRKGVKFSNGKELTAADVAYTFNHTRQPDSGVVTRLLVDWIDNVEAPDAETVIFKAKAPTPAAIEYLSGITPIYPAGHYDKAPTVQTGGKPRRDWGAVAPVCVGPYNLKDFKSGQSATLVKNPDYFAESPKGKPQIGTLVFKTVPDTDTQLAELVTGGLDWIWGVPSENAKQLSAMPNVTVKAAPTTRMSFLSLDAVGRSGDNPMKNVLVRRAIFHAIDRQAIARDLVGEGAEVLRLMCDARQFGCAADIKDYAYDPAKAKALLAEAGYPKGFKIPIYSYRDRPYTEAVMNYLRAVGIDTDLRFLQWKALRPALQEGKTELAHLSWGSQGVLDASASVSNYFKFSIDDYARDQQVKDWLDEADSAIDPAKRKELYGKALARINDQAYMVPLFSYGRTYAFNSDLDLPVTPDELAHFYLARWKK
ncbi:peptide/nickel transport system substrate-binding protein [Bosea sp. BK604]|nr:peptide/nickel transport system substrate-binding protein [Bosea sp. BK604]